MKTNMYAIHMNSIDDIEDNIYVGCDFTFCLFI